MKRSLAITQWEFTKKVLAEEKEAEKLRSFTYLYFF